MALAFGAPAPQVVACRVPTGVCVMNIKAIAIIASCVAFVSVVSTPAAADICDEYRTAIDAFIAESADIIALNETLEAARKGMRAARATRSALRTLETDSSRKILAAAGAPAHDQLEAADAASTATIETFEAIYKQVMTVSDEISAARRAEFNAARIAADGAAAPALDTLGTVESLSRLGALKATTASARTSPGKTTATTLVSVHESIYRAACE